MSATAQADQDLVRQSQRSRQVWAVIVFSTVVFLSLCGAFAWGLADLISSITVPKSASIKALPSSVLAVQRHNTTVSELITGTTSLQEGDIATTGPTDQAFISIFGDSGSIQLYFNSRIEMEKMRTSRFFQSSKEVSIVLMAGTIVLAAGELGDYASASYSLSTDQAE